MIGQVGGMSLHKRPLLTLEPDYVMKPVQTDHRGIREIFLYEAVKVLYKNRSSQQYAALLTGGGGAGTGGHKNQLQLSQIRPQYAFGIIDVWDTLAMWLAMKMNDPIVAENEKIINKSWKAVKKEVDMLRRLATFMPSYYGVVGQRSPLSMPHGEEQAHKAAQGERIKMAAATHENGTSTIAATSNGKTLAASIDSSDVFSPSHYGISLEAHLLLTDITANFYKPCVMDLKMGTQTYEPDAPEGKKLREMSKYPQQEQFGFRIVGFRFYDPTHPDSEEFGFRYFKKDYGRSLGTVDELLDALRLFLSAGCSAITEGSVAEEKNCKAADEKTDEGAAVKNGSTTATAGTDENGENVLSSNSSTASNSKKATKDESQDIEARERVRMRALSSLLAQLWPIIGFFEENKTLSFYASSLLLVYEGDRQCPNPDVTSIKMIDFGRVRREPGGDPGYRHGLRTLKSLMDRIRKEEKQWLQPS